MCLIERNRERFQSLLQECYFKQRHKNVSGEVLSAETFLTFDNVHSTKPMNDTIWKLQYDLNIFS